MNVLSSLRAMFGVYLAEEPEEFRSAEEFGRDQLPFLASQEQRFEPREDAGEQLV